MSHFKFFWFSSWYMRADDQAPVCNMYVTLLHVIIWDNQYNILCVARTTYYVCRHNTSTTIFSSCSPKTISVNVTKSFWIPSDILLFSFLRPLLCYAMLWHVHVISVSWHAHVTFWELSKSDETPWRRRENVKALYNVVLPFLAFTTISLNILKPGNLGINVFIYIIEHFIGPYRTSRLESM